MAMQYDIDKDGDQVDEMGRKRPISKKEIDEKHQAQQVSRPAFPKLVYRHGATNVQEKRCETQAELDKALAAGWSETVKQGEGGEVIHEKPKHVKGQPGKDGEEPEAAYGSEPGAGGFEPSKAAPKKAAAPKGK